MKKMIALLLCLTVVMLGLPVSGIADVSELKWGMTKEDAVRLVAEPSETYEHENGFVEYDYLFSKLINDYPGRLSLVFRNDYLMARAYTVEDSEQQGIFETLCGELDSEYGQATNDISLMVDAFNLLLDASGGDKMSVEQIETNVRAFVAQGVLKSWRVSEDTGVVMILNGYQVMMYYFQPSDQIQE